MLTGKCLCAAVKITIAGKPELDPEACHCRQCRKQSGHYLAAINIKQECISIEGEHSIRWYRSSDKVERGFCQKCGSTLFWKPSIEGYEYTAVCLGMLDTPIARKLSKHTFVGDKGSYYAINDGLPQSDGY